MGDSVVIGVRIPRWVKEELEVLGIDYSKEVREYLLKRVREERGRRLIREMDKVVEDVARIGGNLASEVIRGDRDKDWRE